MSPEQRYPRRDEYVARSYLLTPGERRFFLEALEPAVGHRYLISFKVRLADIIEPSTSHPAALSRIAQKHIDFVLTTPRITRIIAAIELNDESHEENGRRERDELVAAALATAGVPLIPCPVYQRYDPVKLRHNIEKAVSGAKKPRERLARCLSADEQDDPAEPQTLAQPHTPSTSASALLSQVSDRAQVTEDETQRVLRVSFEAKPSSTTRSLLKESGFRWSVANSAWERPFPHAPKSVEEASTTNASPSTTTAAYTLYESTSAEDIGTDDNLFDDVYESLSLVTTK